MFGKNKVVKLVPEDNPGAELRVQEIFYTLQGEGPYSGSPAVFIRLAGCNLRCHWCDTEFDSGLSAPPVVVGKVVEEARQKWPFGASALRRPLFVLTGGEPLRQNITALLQALLHHFPGAIVQIETAATVVHPQTLEFLRHNRGAVHLMVSPKTPKIDSRLADLARHWKYVVGHDDDLDFKGIPITNTQSPTGAKLPLASDRWYFSSGINATQVYISPRDDHDPYKNSMNRDRAVAICLAHGYILSLQVHKAVGLP